MDKEGNVIKIWDFIAQAQKELKIKNISSCCQNKWGYKTTGGFKWKYYE